MIASSIAFDYYGSDYETSLFVNGIVSSFAVLESPAVSLHSSFYF